MGCEKCKIIGWIDPASLKSPEEIKVPEKKLSDDIFSKAEASANKYGVEEEDFRGDYGDGVGKDIEEVERLKRIYDSESTEAEKEMHKYAELMEAMLVEFLNTSEWLGEETHALKTTNFDDYKNKIDIIAEMTNKSGYKKQLGLAIDASFAKDLDGKFKEIRDMIKAGKLSEVKYFKSDNYSGRLRNIPRVVVGVSLDTVKELASMWEKGDMEGIRNHSAQHQILDEMILQLEAFEKYAIKYSQLEVAGVYRESCKTLKEIKTKKVKADSGEYDHMYEVIKNVTENLKNK